MGKPLCSAPRLFAGAVRLPSLPLHPAGVRASSHTQAPLSEGDCIPAPPPSTLQDQLCPRLALRESRSSPTALSASYFYPLLTPRCFGGGSGEATPNLPSSRWARRSSPLPAGWQREEQRRDGEGVRPLVLPRPERSRNPAPSARLLRRRRSLWEQIGRVLELPGAGAWPGFAAAARLHAGSFGSFSGVLALRPNLT
uniref:Uncharacterized protein n=1 Tax=Catagonus wagneri TaxID=51154 RepID=A0A8C3YNR2_9CETA